MELIVETSVFDDERLSDDVQEVQQVASTAMDIAGNNSQYFWCTEVGTDTGVHITLTPQDTFKANPSGYNLLARNNGVEVRDGLTACSVFTNGGAYFNAMLNGTNQLVAKYEASGAQIGAELSGYRNITIDNTNGIRFRNGTVNLAHYNVGSVVFYDGGTTTNHELMNLGTTGMTLKNSSGYNTFYVGNNGLIMYDGADNSHDLLNLNTSGLTLKGIFNNTLSNCATYGADGLVVYGYTNGTTRGEIAKIYSGVGNTQTSGTTKYAPYYTFGTRLSNEASTIGNYSFAEGVDVTASGYTSHAEGYNTIASISCSHAEGHSSRAYGYASHAEGTTSESHSYASHAEGDSSKSYGYASHAEGRSVAGVKNNANLGIYSHSEGLDTLAKGNYSHAEGQSTQAEGDCSHAGGLHTIAGYQNQTAIGKYNNNKSTNLFEVGKGTSASARANAFAVTETGVLEIGDPTNTFVVVDHSISLAAGTKDSNVTNTATFSKSGYYPVGIMGYNTNREAAIPSRMYLSTRSNDSATVSYSIRAVGANYLATTMHVFILWVKIA